MRTTDSPAPPAPEPVDTRVVDSQRQAVRALRLTVAFAAGAPLTAVIDHRTGAWLPLHVFLVGALLTAIVGATVLLAVTWSAAPAPPARRAAVMRWSIAAGAVAVAAGRELELRWVTATGGVLVAAGLALLGHSLVEVRRAGRNDRFHPAIDAYLAALACASVGVALGVAMAVLDTGSWWGQVRDAHVTLNLLGLVGIVVAGTLPFFAATQARTKMSARATPGRLRAATGALTLAVGVTVAGQLLGWEVLAAGGLGLYVGGVVATVRLLPRIGARQLRWAGPRLVQLGAGIAWWLGAVVFLGRAELDQQVMGGRALQVLAVGGFAQVLLASLAYFGPVVRAGGHIRLTAGFAITRSWWSLAGINVAAAALATGHQPIAVVAAGVVGVDLVVRAVRLATT